MKKNHEELMKATARVFESCKATAGIEPIKGRIYSYLNDGWSEEDVTEIMLGMLFV